VEYIPDQNMRLRLYRRLADLQSESEIEAMLEEFTDRFGSLPEMVRNLFFQMKVKLRADAAGLASISLEGDQLVLRYPPLPEGVASRNLPNLGGQVRTGKKAYWMPIGRQGDDWRFDTLRLPNPEVSETWRGSDEGMAGVWQVRLLDTLLLLTKV
jgi:transcription-repair coupling factor (superfamily II helicase)